jgi:hypothetical protein
MKNIHCWISNIKNNKFKEFQIYFHFEFVPEIFCNIALPRSYNKEYVLNIDFVNLLGINVSKNYKTDHAGFRFVLNLLGLNICYSHIDSRHWDDDNDDWCKYPEDE